MPHWTALAAEKKQRQLKSIPQEWLVTPPPLSTLDVTGFPESCGLLNAREIEITNTSVDVLLKRLASAEWTAVDVTTAFSKRAIVAHQLVNCLTEIFIDRALARAAELDDYLKKTGKVVGPLHGLPVSLKDQLCIKGLETTMGYVSWIGQYAEKNAVLVDILIECGAVPFVPHQHSTDTYVARILQQCLRSDN
ncbi:amidase signature domain-containing protein [Suillus fuscotomentosus]|uniref:Amidase signature domain-containing protein n=1 Tax=Suillus fuscotomentosus TaxID=1912939 RepID=A0AAD4HK73_9AGAM|nr:amidase signature domain-containing protein [Suillus fuscotomentosus]KAG1899186.1 amidase signature domain-containing protein [Suillus fuscotomentosus]